MKFKVGQEVKFRKECFAHNQTGIIESVNEPGWTVDNEYTEFIYMVKLITQSSGICTNFYDFEVRLTKKEQRNFDINQLLS